MATKRREEATIRGEIIKRDREGRPQGRFWFRVEEVELPWLRMSEAAFLLWVLALLVAIWLVVALFLLLL